MRLPKCRSEKRCEIQGGCQENFNNNNSGEFGTIFVLAPNSSELSLLNFLPLTYHHSHFLVATLDFASFFTMAFLGAVPFITAWLFWIRYHFFLYLYIPKPSYGRIWGYFNLCFSLPQRKKKDIQSDFQH